MKTLNSSVIAIANEKGGVGKTTTTVNLTQALTIQASEGSKVLGIDFDPQGNFTQASGIALESIRISVADLIRDRSIPEQHAIYKGGSFDLIPATPLLANVAKEMIGMTNGELRLAQRIQKLRLHYDYIFIDSPPTRGALLNSVLNAADAIIIPVDSNFFALQGIRPLLAEIEEIRAGTNSNLKILGILLTFFDKTVVTRDITAHLKNQFENLVFDTKIRTSVKLAEAPMLSKTIFHHAPDSSGAVDHLRLADEVLKRLEKQTISTSPNVYTFPCQGVSHE